MSAKDTIPPAARYAGFEAVPIRITVRAGRARCPAQRLAALEPGQVIVLDQAVGAAFHLLAGGRTLARVEPVAVEHGLAMKLVGPAEEDEEG